MHVPRLVSVWVGLLALGLLSALGIGVAFGQEEDVPSPARGQASVIAQGITALPVGDVGWRVRLATTAASDQTDRNVPGFILVDQGTLLVNDVDATRPTRLAAGEATFLHAPATYQEAPLGNAPVSSYRIDLVAAGEVGDAGDDQREQTEPKRGQAMHGQLQLEVQGMPPPRTIRFLALQRTDHGGWFLASGRNASLAS